MITKRQKQILDFVIVYESKKSFAPSLKEIKKHFGLSSESTIHQHIEALKEKGYLKKHKNQPRGITVIKSDSLVKIPLLGTIAAGEPIEAIEDKETIAVSQRKLFGGGDFYALQVSGESMIDENIQDGDTVIVRSQKSAEDGQKVVALIDNHEVTLKTIYKEKTKIRLQPANSEMKPIFVEPSQLLIQGVVIDIIKNTEQIEHKYNSIDIVRHTIPEHKRPKGCEIIYKGKLKEEDILNSVTPAKLELVKKYGKQKKDNRLILGDNLNILKTLYEDDSVRGKIELIYIDPPFGTGKDFIGYDKSKFYSDKIVNTDFLEFLRKRLIFLRELLADTGSIYLHIDQKIGHYVKIIMDEVFGEENFRNDITRIKCNPKNFERKAFGNLKDVIYFYSKSKLNGGDAITWTDYRIPLSKDEIIKQFSKIDKNGKRYATTPLHAKGETRNGPTGQPWKGLNPPKGRHWRYAPSELTRLDKEGLIEWSSTGNPRKIIYADENRGKKIQDVWDFKDQGFEKSSYPTQKNEALLKQIISASSNKGDIILDCFAGSGTTLSAAEQLGRKWIGIDANQAAVEVAEQRITSLSGDDELFKKEVSFSVQKIINSQ